MKEGYNARLRRQPPGRRRPPVEPQHPVDRDRPPRRGARGGDEREDGFARAHPEPADRRRADPAAEASAAETAANHSVRPQTDTSQIDHTASIVPIKLDGDPADRSTTPRSIPGRSIGPPTSQSRSAPSPSLAAAQRCPAAHSGLELKPPYPASKLASEEEAVSGCRLTIDERGRVIAVEPLGRADPAFLDAARRHLLAHWRYKPAIEDGRAGDLLDGRSRCASSSTADSRHWRSRADRPIFARMSWFPRPVEPARGASPTFARSCASAAASR